MFYLILVSIIWGLSFPIIKEYLSDLNPINLAFIRFIIATLVFTPSLFIYRFKYLKYLKKFNNKTNNNNENKKELKTNKNKIIYFLLLGSLQYGLMYILYLSSYNFLKAYEIALLTITTPIFVVIINQILNNDKKYYINALLVVIGAGVITYNALPNSIFGVLLIQASNLCFALGQVIYKKLAPVNVYKTSFYMYLGASISLLPIFIIFGSFNNVFELSNLIPILYLSIIASGLGFYMWNKGLNKSNIKYISIFNNLKIPFAVIFSVILIGENINVFNLIIGVCLFLLALF